MAVANGSSWRLRPSLGARLESGGAWAVLVVAAVFLGLPAEGRAQVATDFFRQNCTSCHTIGGGRLTGPDLKNVTQQKDRAWLEHFIQNPKAVIDSSDPYALELQREARGVIMPTLPGVTPAMAKSLLDLIEAESKLPKSHFAGMTISSRPFTPADVALGRELFLGTRALSGGGPACIACHTLGTIGALGGGRLGPDLTREYERLGGRAAVGAWLAAPATPTMQSVFRRKPLQPEEILPILALIEDASRRPRPADSASLLDFFLLGFGGMVVGLAVLGRIWRGRFRAVRRPLTRNRGRGEG